MPAARRILPAALHRADGADRHRRDFRGAEPVDVRGRFSNETDRPDATKRSGFLVYDKTGSVFNPFHNETKVRYQANSLLPVIPAAELRQAPADYPEITRRMYLQLPHPRSPHRDARRANHQRRNKSLRQSLENRNVPENALCLYARPHRPARQGSALQFSFRPPRRPLRIFRLRDDDPARTQGIPARYVTGFLPGEYNDVGGDYIIRESDAHAWVEVYFPGYGWITFDPTPPANAQPGGLFERLALVLGLVPIRLERVDRQLRFRPPDESRPEHAEALRTISATARKNITKKSRPADADDSRARQANRSVALFSARRSSCFLSRC